jgi:hypothetical protein
MANGIPSRRLQISTTASASSAIEKRGATARTLRRLAGAV